MGNERKGKGEGKGRAGRRPKGGSGRKDTEWTLTKNTARKAPRERKGASRSRQTGAKVRTIEEQVRGEVRKGDKGGKGGRRDL